MKTNYIGLPLNEVSPIIESLNELLSNFQVYYQNLRGLHWNIKGKRFFDLHVKFEELYTDAQEKIDLLAERILTLGGVPLHTFEDYLANNKLKIGNNIHKDEIAIELIAENISGLLKIERAILKASSEIDDDGTNSMIGDFVGEQEKMLWMLKAWLSE